jgi:hypothetical protein
LAVYDWFRLRIGTLICRIFVGMSEGVGLGGFVYREFKAVKAVCCIFW